MRRVWLLVIVSATVLFLGDDRASAASFTFVSTRAGLGSTDSVDWGQLGGDDTFVPNPSSVTSAMGYGFTVSKTQADVFTRFDQGGCCLNAPPPLANGDHVIMTNDQGNNPNSIILTGAMYAAGTEVFSAAQGAFVARVTAYDSIGNVLASFTASGSTNPTGIGTGLAPFLGIVSDTPFAKIGFSLDSATGDTAYLGIDRVSVSALPVPEPATGLLVMTGLLGLAARRSAMEAE